MAEGSNVQHIAELGVDLGTAYKQLEEFSKYVEQMGVTLNDLSKNNWNLEATISGISNTGSDAQKKLAEEALKANEAFKQQAQSINGVHQSTNNYLGVAARLTGIYSGWQLTNKAIRETLSTLNDVESRMVEIGRVFGATTEETEKLRNSLFGVAQEMANTFDETSMISKRFAQAGYHDIAENIELTRVALLAMNTAELNAVSSTNSLVGILKQWNLEAEDLITVVDKLNYTADNNATTTQDLVDALLRSSSAAKNSKISFDELVGTVVTLAEATGRTGRELGTAVNSLIAFTTRASSMKVFESFGVQVYLDEQKTQLNSVMEIWRQLSEVYKTNGDQLVDVLSTQTDMTELFSEEVANAAGELDKYNQILETQTKLAGELSDTERLQLTQQFGVYRRNYVIALLEDFGKIQEVVDDMDNAMGHSERQNEAYLETLEAKVNQLQTALKALAVQLGESGLLEIAKFFIDAATAVATLTKNTGGLVPVIILLATAYTRLKNEATQAAVAATAANAATAATAGNVAKVNVLTQAMNSLKTAAASSGTVIGTLGAGLNALLGPIGWITLGVQALIGVYGAWNAEQEKARQAALSSAETNLTYAKSLQTLKDEYLDIVDSEGTAQEKTESLNEWKRKLIETYGLEKDALDKVNLSRETGIELLEKEIEGSLAKGISDIASEYEKAARAMEVRGKGAGFEGYWVEADKLRKQIILTREEAESLTDMMGELGLKVEEVGNFSGDKFRFDITADTKSVIEQQELLSKAISALNLEKQSEIGLTEAQQIALNGLQSAYKNVTSIVEEHKDVYDRGNQLYAQQIILQNDLHTANVQSKEDYDSLVNSVDALTASEGIRSAIIKELAVIYSEYSAEQQDFIDATNDAASALGEWAISLSEIEGGADGLITKINDLESAMKSLADGKGLSLEATLDLIDKYPELADAIDIVGDSWEWSGQKLEELRSKMNAQRAELEAYKIAQMLAASGNDDLANSAEELAAKIVAATSAEERMIYITELLKIAASDAASGLDGMSAAAARLKLIMSGLDNTILDTKFSYQGNADLIKQQTEALKAQTDAINENIKALQKEQKESDKVYKKKIEQLQKEKKLQDELDKDRIKALQEEQKQVNKLYQDRIKALQSELKEITANYKAQEEAVKKRYNAEIEALRKLKQEENRSDDEEDYNRKRDEILRKIAEEEKKTGQQAVENIKSLKKELEELDRQEERRLRNNAIDDQISDIEKRRDAELEAIKKESEAEKERYDNLIENLQRRRDEEKENFDARIKIMQDEADESKKSYDSQIEDIKEKQQTEREALEAQIEGLREQIEAAKKASESQIKNSIAVGESNSQVTRSITEYFSRMYQAISDRGHSWVTQAMREGENLLTLYTRIFQTLQQATNVGIYGPPNINNFPSYFGVKSSHTGSLITGDGLVNVKAAELVVRDDISAGLMRTNEFVRQMYNNYHNSYATSQNNSRNYQFGDINLNGGQFGNRSQAQRAGRSIADELQYALNKMP